MQVDLIYRDSSIGNMISISVVKIMVLKENESFASRKNQSSVSASDMLNSFCKWQKGQNQSVRSRAKSYDVALLLTRQVMNGMNAFLGNINLKLQICRENICRHPVSPNHNCDTLGLAELGTICKDHSCAIVQDNGLSAAFTIAHELGHV